MKCWLCVGVALVICGEALGMCCRCVGNVSAICWRSGDYVLVKFQLCVSDVFGYSRSVGYELVMLWPCVLKRSLCVADAMVMFRGCVGEALAMCR